MFAVTYRVVPSLEREERATSTYSITTRTDFSETIAGTGAYIYNYAYIHYTYIQKYVWYISMYYPILYTQTSQSISISIKVVYAE